MCFEKADDKSATRHESTVTSSSRLVCSLAYAGQAVRSSTYGAGSERALLFSQGTDIGLDSKERLVTEFKRVDEDSQTLQLKRRCFRYMPAGAFDVEPIVELFDQPVEPLLLALDGQIELIDPDWHVEAAPGSSLIDTIGIEKPRSERSQRTTASSKASFRSSS